MENTFQRILFAINSVKTKPSVRLVAVSKRQPIEAIIDLYHCGQRVFGENYIQELYDKSFDEKILKECPDIEWRFIGHLQTNKVNQLLRINNLKAIETIDCERIARLIQRGLQSNRNLDAMIQINCSEETNKNGVKVEQVLPLVTLIREECPNINIEGLMTIGRLGHDVTNGPNPDFETLIACKQQLKEKLGIDLKLSFGMSDDFEHAVEMGSDEVRVGTALFGLRN